MNAPLASALSEPAVTRVSPGATLTIYSVAEFAAACRAQLARSSVLEIDLGGVTACDTLGVQLLLSARRTALARGKVVRFVAVSPAVAKAAAAVGCTGALSGEAA